MVGEPNLGRKTLTISKNHCDYEGPLLMFVVGHLIKMETLKNRVSDNQNGCAGRTVERIKVRRMCQLVTFAE